MREMLITQEKEDIAKRQAKVEAGECCKIDAIFVYTLIDAPILLILNDDDDDDDNNDHRYEIPTRTR